MAPQNDVLEGIMCLAINVKRDYLYVRTAYLVLSLNSSNFVLR